MYRKIILLSTVIPLFLKAGCVTKGTCVKKVDEMSTIQAKQQAENDNLKNELATLQKKSYDLSAQNTTIQDQLNKTNMEKDQLVNDRSELEEILNSKSLTKTVYEMRQENTRLKTDIAELRKSKETEVQSVKKTYEDLVGQMKGEIAQGEITITQLKGKLILNVVNEILFESEQAEVKAQELKVLQKVVDILKNIHDKNIKIEGHTDNVPITGALAKVYPTNLEFSTARAINVTKYLQKQGIGAENLSCVAYGEYKPIADNSTSEGWAKNRRIAIILQPKD
ncbi:MAG: OmpA family protein [Syntrophales bacterium]|jgi:chemotaxis protein MotB